MCFRKKHIRLNSAGNGLKPGLRTICRRGLWASLFCFWRDRTVGMLRARHGARCMELKCPHCQAPIYSSKAAVCGRCEAPLPVELVAVAADNATTFERIERACREARPVEE